MTDHSFYNQELHGPYETFELGNLALEASGTLPNAKLAYATFGTLSKTRDNAILVTTWFSGTSKIIEQAYIGEGRALDPSRYFIVVANQIGNGLSSSPHNTPAPLDGPRFPTIQIADDVRAQKQLLQERFGIDRLQLVAGGSMGAQQTFEWAVRFPDSVLRAAAIAGTARTTSHNKLFAQTLMDAITSDPAWAAGHYQGEGAVAEGLRRHSRLWAVMGANPVMYTKERWKELGFPSLDAFLEGLLDASFLPLDANALLTQGRKWQDFDVARQTGGDLAAALGRITAKTFVMPIDTDMFFTIPDCEAEQRLIRNSTLRVLHTDWGHVGLMGMDPAFLQQVDAALAELLKEEVLF